jgi:hypothetical protein
MNMSTYKIIDSTISILYCAKCANEHLEVISPGRLVCPDCGSVSTFDTSSIRVGQLKGTKYKMRDTRRYSFREIIDEGREDAFREVYVPSPEPGRSRVGWRSEEMKEKAEEGEIRMAGVDNQPGQGWRNETVVDMVTSEAVDQEEDHDTGDNGRNEAACAI